MFPDYAIAARMSNHIGVKKASSILANDRLSRLCNSLLSLTGAVLLTSCAGQAGVTAANDGDHIVPAISDIDRCTIALAAEPTAASMRFDQTHMRLLNWNTHKNTAGDLQADLSRLADGADLILLQEAVRDGDAMARIDDNYFQSFADGYQRAEENTGVMTASRVAPLAQCQLTHYEPWLKSPKATSITEFALRGSNETLLVINLHLINFTLGTKAMQQQLLEALSFLDFHRGPVIVSGDFNTWRYGRSKLVVDEFQARGLQPVEYTDDVRKRFRGYALDHTYVRGARVTQGTSHAVDSSDHNPMSVTLEF